ncbi:expressed unknown protein [Seminavis robusta]|uniref:Uncharacterized protein n=1 Tax=Seminavis robusta TaxID=568900 RepID=A0A9N8DY63_9STRA|nr:expressed unknown protein [Seminavis robusta]|eukprot:Sro384_g131480.1 n/a (241) ;mRNA; f:40618-41460
MEYFDHYSHHTASEAKKEYFLTTKDLAHVPYKSESFGFGTGRPTRWYKFDDLEAVALAKHGAAGLAKKRAARKKRQFNQQQKELAAQKAKEDLTKKVASSSSSSANDENAPNNNNATEAAGVVVCSAKDLQKLQKDIQKAFKPMITYDHMRRKNKQNYCEAKVEVPRVPTEQYAALIGRPADTKLTSVVKKGAWYREVVSYKTVMGHSNPMTGSGGRYGCNSELGIDSKPDLVITAAEVF